MIRHSEYSNLISANLLSPSLCIGQVMPPKYAKVAALSYYFPCHFKSQAMVTVTCVTTERNWSFPFTKI